MDSVYDGCEIYIYEYFSKDYFHSCNNDVPTNTNLGNPILKVNNKNYFLISEPFYGTLVKGNSLEDIPEKWVKFATNKLNDK